MALALEEDEALDVLGSLASAAVPAARSRHQDGDGVDDDDA